MTQGVALRPTEEQRRTVRAMAGFGIPQEDIATFLDIDPKTLRKHFQAELEKGSIEATTKVAQSLFRMATEGKNVAAAIFWMKARAGWREKQEVEHSLRGIVSSVPRAEDLSDDDLARIIALNQGRREIDGEAEEHHELSQEEWLHRHGGRAGSSA